jgi:predicted 3-demethylubiquinone-9 3-methyltransferase (glyoxalase superfamily)
MQKIKTFLWFNGQAEEAAKFYVSVFKNSRILKINRFEAEEGPMPKGTVISTEFSLDGQTFFALNGGPMFSFTPAISLYVDCADQAEVDEMWKKLLEGGGEEQPCGWLKDRFGLSWQVIPKALPQLIADPNPKKAGAAVQAMMGMKKIDVAALQKAHAKA